MQNHTKQGQFTYKWLHWLPPGRAIPGVALEVKSLIHSAGKTSTTHKAGEKELRGTKPVGLKAWVTSELSSHKEGQLINHCALAVMSKRQTSPSKPKHAWKRNCVVNA